MKIYGGSGVVVPLTSSLLGGERSRRGGKEKDPFHTGNRTPADHKSLCHFYYFNKDRLYAYLANSKIRSNCDYFDTEML
jgi:hypothetical protein